MTKNMGYSSIISNKSISRACVVAALAGLLATSCFLSVRDQISEHAEDSAAKIYTLKDGRRAEIKYEKLIRSSTPYSWLSGIAQPSTEVYCYMVVTATIKKSFGRDTVYRWIDAIPDHAVYFTKVNKLVLTQDNAFIEYTHIPAFPADDYWHYSYINDYESHRNRNPFGGDPRLLVKYGTYHGTRALRQDKDDPSPQIHAGTYKWPERYIWDDISKEIFDKAAEAGDVISFDNIGSNGKFEFYYSQTRLNEDIYYYGKRAEKDAAAASWAQIRPRIDYYDYYRRRIIKDSELDLFLSSVKTGNAVKVEALLKGKPALIDSYDPDGMTALHLVLLSRDRYHLLPVLFKYNPQINALDYKGRTPLKMAFIAYADKAVTGELIKRGGKVLWDDCSSFEEALDAKLRLSSQKGQRQNANSSAWLGDDGYQVWMEIDRSRPSVGGHDSRRTALLDGRERIIRELGLQGAMHSALSARMEMVLDNAHVACARPDKNARMLTHYLVRICAPDLRKLVDQYHPQR